MEEIPEAMGRRKSKKIRFYMIGNTFPDGDDSNLGIVVADPRRHALEKLEGSFMTFLERLGTFAGKCAYQE